MADREAVERRVYNLPADLLERLRAFQVAAGIASEAEAARRLLDSALQMRDTIETLLETLKAKFAEERDLRTLASDVLARHALVSKLEIDDGVVTFDLRSGDRGRIDRKGMLCRSEPGWSEDHWQDYRPPNRRPSISSTPKLPPTTGGDLDDEIPF